MKKSLLILFWGISVLMFFSGCRIDGADLTAHEFFVRGGDWVWNNTYKRYEYFFDCSDIDAHVYQEGEVSGHVYITEYDEYTVSKPLPYVLSYTDGHDVYTETMSFDISVGTIGFYIQQSDLSETSKYLQNYIFKITIIR